MKKLFVILFSLSICLNLFAQNEAKPEGWKFGALPTIAFDSDLGFQYGAVVNFYDYGKPSINPFYKHSLYLEVSRFTKGSGINQFKYDSEYLIPGIRVTAEASLLTEKALDFYGFNGYQSDYNADFTDEDSNDYISRLYYRHGRKLTRIKLDLQGNILGRKLKWIGGFLHYGNKISAVDIEALNKGKSSSSKLPDVNTLYDNYVEWGIIPEDQKEGGKNNFLKLGLVYDTRDNEPNPNKGIWTEAFLLTGPKFLGNKNYSYTKLILTHRQYFTVLKNKLTFAYRLSYQKKISGTMPFYMLPYLFDLREDRDGLGGAKTVRGVLRNRITGEDMAFGNFEFRWKFLNKTFGTRNLYLCLTPFIDMGMVTGEFDFIQTSGNMLIPGEEKLHIGYGTGLRIALDQNFIVALDYGIPLDKKDGSTGFYINLDFLF
ncbi:BamA/TamA family outer membrane protein [Bacteroidota bacterium]